MPNSGLYNNQHIPALYANLLRREAYIGVCVDDHKRLAIRMQELYAVYFIREALENDTLDEEIMKGLQGITIDEKKKNLRVLTDEDLRKNLDNIDAFITRIKDHATMWGINYDFQN